SRPARCPPAARPGGRRGALCIAPGRCSAPPAGPGRPGHACWRTREAGGAPLRARASTPAWRACAAASRSLRRAAAGRSRDAILGQANSQATRALVDPIAAVVDEQAHQPQCQIDRSLALHLLELGAGTGALSLGADLGLHLRIAADGAANVHFETPRTELEGDAHLPGEKDRK